MLNLWTTDASVSGERASCACLDDCDATTEGEKKAYTHYDFAMAPTKGLKDFRCIWKLNSAGPPEPAALLNTRGADNDKTQTQLLMQAWWYLGCLVMTRHKQISLPLFACGKMASHPAAFYAALLAACPNSPYSLSLSGSLGN